MDPNLKFENSLWGKGYKTIVGIDEVGRGAFAGPFVVGCVSFPKTFSLSKIPEGINIRDSKKMTPKQRELASGWIQKKLLWSVGVVSVKDINRGGIVSAFDSGIVRALDSFHTSTASGVDYLLIDGKFTPKIGKYNILEKTAIVKGDGVSMSIAAASIVAKVYRDNLMVKLSNNKKLNPYLWDKNKGYGTLEHRNAIENHGVSIHHRKQFVKNYI